MSENFSLNLTLKEFLDLIDNQRRLVIIPLSIEVQMPKLSPVQIFQGVADSSGFLLESMEGSEKIARYSYIGTGSDLTVTIGSTVKIEGNPEFVSIVKDPQGTDPISVMRSIFSRFNYVNLKAPRFFGGFVGHFSYDMVHSLYPHVRQTVKEGSDLPLAAFTMSRDCIVLDHVRKTLTVFASAFLSFDREPVLEYGECRRKIETIIKKISILELTKLKPETFVSIKPVSQDRIQRMSHDEFINAVEITKKYINDGEIFQAVISQKSFSRTDKSSIEIYQSLRANNPSPYMYLINFPDYNLIGSSPEMLVRVERREITTVPIAGTRPRGKTGEEDEKYRSELLSSEKEIAEHTMLVDLARNDIGIVAKFGSVEVKDCMQVEKFSHVQHLTSTVTGELKDNLDAFDAFRACFPAGTVSGAPKVRAMQIIEELEPTNRGIYAGAVGYIGFDGNLEFAIAIRTIIHRDGLFEVQTGAGIVADSIPESEWEEAMNKAKGLLIAIECPGELN